MKLYHGTSEGRVKKILQEGLKPRHMTGKTNWKHTIESNPEAVYLTDAYPMYFACQASKDGERWAVVEVDTDLLDQDKLHPDEDVLEQAGRNYDLLPKSWNMIKRTRHYRKLAPGNPNWQISLRAMGTCAYYGTIPVEAITRVALFDKEKYDAFFTLSLIDASICLLNYKFCGDNYKARTQWLMGECQDTDLVGGFFGAEGFEDSRKAFAAEIAKRDGIEIVENSAVTVP